MHGLGQPRARRLQHWWQRRGLTLGDFTVAQRVKANPRLNKRNGASLGGYICQQSECGDIYSPPDSDSERSGSQDDEKNFMLYLMWNLMAMEMEMENGNGNADNAW